jgi:hypothetical protein
MRKRRSITPPLTSPLIKSRAEHLFSEIILRISDAVWIGALASREGPLCRMGKYCHPKEKMLDPHQRRLGWQMSAFHPLQISRRREVNPAVTDREDWSKSHSPPREADQEAD